MIRFESTRINLVLTAPNALSLNTPAATSVYLSMEKSEAYRFPAHDDIVGIFFKQDTKEAHRDRKRIWNSMFTPNGYVFSEFPILIVALTRFPRSCLGSHSLFLRLRSGRGK